MKTVVTGFEEIKQSLGMKLTKERIEIISKIKSMPVHFCIVDMKDKNENAVGTKIELWLPLECI